VILRHGATKGVLYVLQKRNKPIFSAAEMQHCLIFELSRSGNTDKIRVSAEDSRNGNPDKTSHQAEATDHF
jgi:hypothetical protein